MVAISWRGSHLIRPDWGVRLPNLKGFFWKEPFRQSIIVRGRACDAVHLSRNSSTINWDRLKAMARRENSKLIHQVFENVIHFRMDEYL